MDKEYCLIVERWSWHSWIEWMWKDIPTMLFKLNFFIDSSVLFDYLEEKAAKHHENGWPLRKSKNMTYEQSIDSRQLDNSRYIIVGIVTVLTKFQHTDQYCEKLSRRCNYRTYQWTKVIYSQKYTNLTKSYQHILG